MEHGIIMYYVMGRTEYLGGFIEAGFCLFVFLVEFFLLGFKCMFSR